ncbi:uncharacterized protein EDB93DRAFT_1159856 [Suillus bovinus]|uniref:uncharacterized protein n=1 Tax=Suillus bovinus TaxID=48563 RepID=UPI001B865BD8|nr:uncharacterized protein EDB93DRAFT_1159856 [Suillus bovinus]KAG2141432.1 hypothetical protein EDB93DRAFT_1159856 [Suillus bovinus]
MFTLVTLFVLHVYEYLLLLFRALNVARPSHLMRILEHVDRFYCIDMDSRPHNMGGNVILYYNIGSMCEMSVDKSSSLIRGLL